MINSLKSLIYLGCDILFFPANSSITLAIRSLGFQDKLIKSFEDKQKKVNKTALQTVHKFFAELDQKKINFNTQNIIINKIDSFSGSMFIKKDKAAICLDSEIIEEASKGKLCHACKFVILHELGHIVHKDSLQYRISLLAESLIGLLAWSILYCYTSYLTACLVAKVTATVFSVSQNYLSRSRESQADTFACKIGGPKVAFGGLYYFMSQIYQNIGIRKKYWKHYFLYSPIGNNRVDFAHPPLTERFQKLSKHLPDKAFDQVSKTLLIKKKNQQYGGVLNAKKISHSPKPEFC